MTCNDSGYQAISFDPETHLPHVTDDCTGKSFKKFNLNFRLIENLHLRLQPLLERLPNYRLHFDDSEENPACHQARPSTGRKALYSCSRFAIAITFSVFL